MNLYSNMLVPALFISFFAGSGIVIMEYSKNQPARTKRIETRCTQSEVEALKYNNGTQGFFLFVYGRAGIKSYYSFYKKSSTKMETLDAKRVDLREEERENIILEECHDVTIVEQEGKIIKTKYPMDREKQYKIIVPKGTIENIYNLDLQ